MEGPAPLVTTRPAESGDEPLLFGLFCADRADALAGSGLPPQTVEHLMRAQYAGRRMSYRAQYPGAAWQILLAGPEAVGAAVVDRGPAGLTVVDIVIAGKHRGRGIGTAWLRQRLDEAAAAGVPARLSVDIDNDGARRLYERLGFRVTRSTETHIEMERAPAAP